MREPLRDIIADKVGLMLFLLLLLMVTAPLGAELPQWRETTVTDSLKMGYQLVAADMNRDGTPDLIEMGERTSDHAWLETPTRDRHVLIQDVPRTIKHPV